jgi:hypothetical protein
MNDFELIMAPDGDSLVTSKSGVELLRSPLYNKGTGAVAVAKQAVEDGVSSMSALDVESEVTKLRWQPRYPSIVSRR